MNEHMDMMQLQVSNKKADLTGWYFCHYTPKRVASLPKSKAFALLPDYYPVLSLE
jgi:hypothetical protein